LTLAALVFWGVTANAAAPVRPKPIKVTAITAEWKTVSLAEATRAAAPDEAAPPANARVSTYAGFFSVGGLFARSAKNEQEPLPPVAVIATLRDSSGAPIGFKPVEFSVKTGLGNLSFGSRPTLADGKVQLIIKDRRYGTYPVQVAFRGDEEYAPANFNISVNFGPRPSTSLPSTGVLITPYATPSIAVPFLVFYGIMWVAFVYTFGYLILWKMRRVPRDTEPAPSMAPSAASSTATLTASSPASSPVTQALNVQQVLQTDFQSK
jgi:hypothetical protein